MRGRAGAMHRLHLGLPAAIGLALLASWWLASAAGMFPAGTVPRPADVLRAFAASPPSVQLRFCEDIHGNTAGPSSTAIIVRDDANRSDSSACTMRGTSAARSASPHEPLRTVNALPSRSKTRLHQRVSNASLPCHAVRASRMWQRPSTSTRSASAARQLPSARTSSTPISSFGPAWRSPLIHVTRGSRTGRRVRVRATSEA